MHQARTLLCLVFGIACLMIFIKYIDKQTGSQIFTRQSKSWNSKNIATKLRNWLERLKTGKKKGGVQVKMFDPDTALYGPVPHSALTLEYADEDEESYTGVLPLGNLLVITLMLTGWRVTSWIFIRTGG